MLRDPDMISFVVHRADVVHLAAVQFELNNVAGNSDRVAWMYARSRIRY